MHKYFKLAIFALLLVVFVAANDGGSSGGDSTSGGNQGGGNGGEDGHRHLSALNSTDSNVQFESSDNATDSSLLFSVETEEGVFKLRLHLNVVSSNGTKIEGEFHFAVLSLVEYLENNNQTGYQSGEEVDTVHFQHSGWNPISCTSADTTYSCEVSTADGQFAAVVHIVSNVTIVNGVPVKPTGCKLDIIINKTSRQEGTRLAIVTELQSEVSQAEKPKSDEEEEGFAKQPEKQVSFGDIGFFSWVPTASVNGNSFAVISGSLYNDVIPNKRQQGGAGEHSNGLVFSFDTLEVGEIVWDPKLGSSSQTYTAIDSVSTGYSVVPAISAVLVMLFALFF